MHMEIPEELKNEKIVKLTLQPLIENAIQHGLAHKHSQADIWIIGEKSDDTNYIHVIDNGKGISEEKLKKLQELEVYKKFTIWTIYRAHRGK